MLTNVSASRLMRREGLSIVGKFPKVNSNYVLSGAEDRYLIRLGEKSYSSTHQVRKGGNWIDIAKSVCRGSLESVQEQCMEYMKLLIKNDYC